MLKDVMWHTTKIKMFNPCGSIPLSTISFRFGGRCLRRRQRRANRGTRCHWGKPPRGLCRRRRPQEQMQQEGEWGVAAGVVVAHSFAGLHASAEEEGFLALATVAANSGTCTRTALRGPTALGVPRGLICRRRSGTGTRLHTTQSATTTLEGM